MLQRQRERLRAKLQQIDRALKKRPQKPQAVERRIGKWLGRNTIAERVFEVELLTESGLAIGVRITEDERKRDWASASQGAYLLRTNCAEADPRRLWRWYIQLTEVEDAFRVGKGDLGLRPVFHQREDRVQSHILVCFVALVMWRYLEMWLHAKGLGDCARQVLEQMSTIHSLDVVLPVKDQTAVRLRVVAKPPKLTADLLERLELRLPTRPKVIQNVVEKNRGQ